MPSTMSLKGDHLRHSYIAYMQQRTCYLGSNTRDGNRTEPELWGERWPSGKMSDCNARGREGGAENARVDNVGMDKLAQ